MSLYAPPGPTRRFAAAVALSAPIIAAVTVVETTVQEPVMLVVLVGSVALTTAAIWYALTRRGIVRFLAIVTALLASDLMVSVDVSSPCYYARALDIPQLIFRVAGSAVNDAHLPNFSDVPMVSDHDGLRAMLRALATQRSALPGRTASTLDGLASRRIVATGRKAARRQLAGGVGRAPRQRLPALGSRAAGG